MNFKFRSKINISPYIYEVTGIVFKAPIFVNNICSSEFSNTDSLCFTSNDIPANYGFIINKLVDGNKALIVDDPRTIFAQVLHLILQEHSIVYEPNGQIHYSSNISSTAIIGKNVSIGKNTYIHDKCIIHDNVSIGDNCVIREFSSIGGDGFGFVKDKYGNNLRFPHIGSVVIENNCEIGVFNTVNRGTLGNTIVRRFTKTDAHVHIAHNCEVSANSILTAAAVLSGGVKLGENVWVGPNSVVKQKLELKKDSLIGIGAVVTKSTDDGSVVAGNPAKNIRRSTND